MMNLGRLGRAHVVASATAGKESVTIERDHPVSAEQGRQANVPASAAGAQRPCPARLSRALLSSHHGPYAARRCWCRGSRSLWRNFAQSVSDP
jgi:hypothetical protein